jgi:Domain of unknown function (DUF397)
MNWRKSSYSENSGNCVEVAAELDGGQLVRNSHYPEWGEISFTADGWTEFVKAVKERDFAHQPGGVEVELLADGGARMTDGTVTLTFTPDEWSAFELGVNDGEFD